MTKRAVKKALGLTTDAELARFFGIGRWAVGQWPQDKAMPEGRQWQAKALRPDVFGPAPKKKGVRHAAA
ncbi:hypothetical protein TP46_12330 [Xanthomonas citri pv. aurantifolii]|nr:hypothetical protein [Xanthomonas citri]MCC8492317.1 hypothetical protein [Xanthomonas citri pv. fuscans]TBW96725.1 hypothetical protein TP49_11835 [Xanthomonas citri pv. aurantifolii]TBX03238.1 hypothetical protein TP46_12330 [Xanthomonas citri pv. aurantifolii]